MGPYNITQVDVPGALAAYEGRQQNRMLQMMQQRQIERQDRMDERQAAHDEEEAIESKLERYREQFVQGARLLEGVNDAATYQQARQAAVRAGMDVSEVPASYDPAYVESVRRIARAYTPQQQGQGYTLNPGDIRFDANNQPVARGAPQPTRYYSVPQGGRLVAEPGAGSAAPRGAPPPQAIQYLRQNPGTVAQFNEMYGEGAAEQILQGGPTPAASGGFPW